MSFAASRRKRRLLKCGVVGGHLFVTTFTALGATMPERYR